MITATAYGDGSGTLAIDGEPQQRVSTEHVDSAREALLDLVRDRARTHEATVRVLAVDPAGRWTIDVAPDGSVQPVADPTPQTTAVTPERSSTSPAPQATASDSDRTDTTKTAIDAAGMTKREAREQSFLSPRRIEEPPARGWRAVMASIGIKVKPSAAEVAHRNDVFAVSRHWVGPRTIAVVNGKGGAGKTPATVMLSAVFARYGGGGVLAWDNNDTRGTLGWRTEQGPHEAHVRDLLPHVDRLMDSAARAADIAGYVHHQAVDKYDVLRSNPASLPGDQRLTEADFDAVHTVASRYFRLMFIDSGNAEDAPHWLRMIDHADQLVVATSTRSDHAEAARLLLNALHGRDARSAGLADGAIVVVSQADRDEKPAAEVAAHYSGLARDAVTIPYDKAMRADWLRYDGLDPATQRAWLRAAAAVAGGL